MRPAIPFALLLIAAPLDAGRRGGPIPGASLPFTFEKNLGQAAPELAFLARGGGFALGLGADGARIAVAGGGELHLELEGARPAPPVPVDRLPGRVSYLIGDDPAAWVREAPTYSRLRRNDVLPGVDQVFYDAGGELEYDLVVEPGVDPSSLLLRYRGAERLELDGEGNLLVHAGGAALVQRAPVAYQLDGGERVPVASAYLLRGGDVVGFELGPHDAGRPLVIDPVLVHATAIGGSGSTIPVGVAVGEHGALYVGGSTSADDLPTVNAFQPFFAGSGSSDDFWVAKLDRFATTLHYLTYIGGTDIDRAAGLALAPDGSAVIAGFTQSDDFPVEAALLPAAPGLGDGAVAKLAPSGAALVFATYLGGFGPDSVHDVATGVLGDVYLTGATSADDFPVSVNAFQPAKSFGKDAFVTRLTAAGGLAFSTYFGAGASTFSQNTDEAYGIAVHGQRVWILGQTRSPNLPLLGPQLSQDDPDSQDLFVARFDSSGFPDFSSYLGGSDLEEAEDGDIAAHPSGAAAIVAATDSLDFPTTAGALLGTNPPDGDAVVCRIDPGAPQALVFSTFLGDAGGGAKGFAVAFGEGGTVWVGGNSNHDGFPLVRPIVGKVKTAANALLAQLSPDGSRLLASTFLGGASTPKTVRGIAPDRDGDVIVVVDSPDLSLAGAPPQVVLGPQAGVRNTILARIADDCTPPRTYGLATAGRSGRPPSIEAVGPARLGNERFAIRSRGFAGGARVTQLLGRTEASLPLAGIRLLVDPADGLRVAERIATGRPGVPGVGSVTFPLPLADDPALVGTRLFVQHLAVDRSGREGLVGTGGLALDVCGAP